MVCFSFIEDLKYGLILSFFFISRHIKQIQIMLFLKNSNLDFFQKPWNDKSYEKFFEEIPDRYFSCLKMALDRLVYIGLQL